MTILQTVITGVSELSDKAKPSDVLSLMSRLYSKFDLLCEQQNVYKLHTMGDMYVVMGYSGKVAKDRRTLEDSIIEGYNILQVAMQMLDIVKEERNRSSSLLRNLDMKVGIHTGKILGGIIGSRIIRYDIFGQDVLTSKKVLEAGESGSVVVSQKFTELIKNKQFIWDTFDWQETTKIRVEGSEKKLQIFRVEQIFAVDGSSSEDMMEAGHEHKGDA